MTLKQLFLSISVKKCKKNAKNKKNMGLSVTLKHSKVFDATALGKVVQKCMSRLEVPNFEQIMYNNYFFFAGRNIQQICTAQNLNKTDFSVSKNII